MDDINEKQRLEKVFKKTVFKVRNVLNLFNPENYTSEIVKTSKDVWIKETKDAFLVAAEAKFDLEDFHSEDEKKEDAKTMKALENEVTKFIFDSNAKALEGCLPTLDPSILAKKEAQVSFDIDHQKLSEEIESMNNELSKIDDWSNATSNQVEAAIGKIPAWRKQVLEISNIFYSMKKTAKMYDLDNPEDPDDKLESSKDATELLKETFDEVLEKLLFEDEARCLYAQIKSKPANVSYPTFSGSMMEDFFKFKDEVQDAFESNQVRREDRVKLLRSCLQSTPKNLIPESMRNIDDAWEILDEMYDDPVRITMSRTVKLKNLGNFPYPNTTDSKKSEVQMKWCMEMELLIKDLMSYGDNGNEDCYNLVYNPGTWKTILNLFPDRYWDDMILFSGSTRDILLRFSDYIIELRNTAKGRIQVNPFGESFEPGEHWDPSGHAANSCYYCLEIIDQCACPDEYKY